MIDNQTAVKFSNEHVRRAADLLAQGYFSGKALLAQYSAQDLETLFINDEVVADGSDKDGRSSITGADAKTIIAMVKSHVDSIEANSEALLNAIMKVAVNPIRQ